MSATIARVAQAEPNGCGVACLAMLSASDYATVREDFPDMPSQGLSEVQMLHWLNERGWWYRRWWVCEPPADRAPLALALVREAHWVVVYRDTVLDPARDPALPLTDYDVLKWIEMEPPPLYVEWDGPDDWADEDD